MTERDKIYVQILHVGLIALRNAAYSGNVKYWEIEAQHLHNVPSLIGETNEHRHDYYFDAERMCYLEQVEGSTSETHSTLSRYKELWEQLEKLRPQK